MAPAPTETPAEGTDTPDVPTTPPDEATDTPAPVTDTPVEVTDTPVAPTPTAVPPTPTPAPPEDLCAVPVVISVPQSQAPAGLEGISPRCVVSADSGASSESCPVLAWRGWRFWAFSYDDNRTSMAIVQVDPDGEVVRVTEKAGARYVYSISVDTAADVVTFSGQGGATVVSDFDENVANKDGFYYRNVELFVSGGEVGLLLGTGQGWFTIQTPVSTSVWTHVAATFDGSSATLFVDGEPRTSGSATLAEIGVALLIGARPVNDGAIAAFFDGKMDSVRISDRVLYSGSFDPAEALLLEDSTVALWNFSEGTGTLTANETGGDSLLNSPLWSTDCAAAN